MATVGRPKKVPPHPVNPRDIVNWYVNKKFTIRELAWATGLAYSEVRRILIAMDVTLRNRGRQLNES